MKRLIILSIALGAIVLADARGIKGLIRDYLAICTQHHEFIHSSPETRQTAVDKISRDKKRLSNELAFILKKQDSTKLDCVSTNYLINGLYDDELVLLKSVIAEIEQRSDPILKLSSAINRAADRIRQNRGNFAPKIPEAEQLANGSSMTMVPTFYVIAQESGFPAKGEYLGVNYDGSEYANILSPGGKWIATVSGRFFAYLCMNGSGQLKSEKKVGWAGNKRFYKLPWDCWGYAGIGYRVIPWHTAAVDSHKLMSWDVAYYIPATDGIIMPDNKKHDGVWFPHDTGEAFKGKSSRIDLYIGWKPNMKIMNKHDIYSLKTELKVYICDEDTTVKVYKQYWDKMTPTRQDDMKKGILED